VLDSSGAPAVPADRQQSVVEGLVTVGAKLHGSSWRVERALLRVATVVPGPVQGLRAPFRAGQSQSCRESSMFVGWIRFPIFAHQGDGPPLALPSPEGRPARLLVTQNPVFLPVSRQK
jgi:hypothetical protein